VIQHLANIAGSNFRVSGRFFALAYQLKKPVTIAAEFRVCLP